MEARGVADPRELEQSMSLARSGTTMHGGGGVQHRLWCGLTGLQERTPRPPRQPVGPYQQSRTHRSYGQALELTHKPYLMHPRILQVLPPGIGCAVLRVRHPINDVYRCGDSLPVWDARGQA